MYSDIYKTRHPKVGEGTDPKVMGSGGDGCEREVMNPKFCPALVSMSKTRHIRRPKTRKSDSGLACPRRLLIFVVREREK